jgi:hypothetical protein
VNAKSGSISDPIDARVMPDIFKLSTATERAVMAATDELIGRNMIEDATVAELKRHLSDEQILGLFYSSVAKA